MKNKHRFIIATFLVLFLITFSGSRNIFLGDLAEKDYSGFYVLDEFGDVYTSGSAIFFGDLGLRSKDAVDIEVEDEGYYLLDKSGKVFNFGDAEFYGDANIEEAIDLEISDNGYYILDKQGIVHDYGFVKDYGQKEGDYVDMEVVESGYYLLKSNGGIEVLGKAKFLGESKDIDAVGLGVNPKGYYILERNGKVHLFGDLEDYGYENVMETARDIEIVPSGEGFYVLDAHGNTFSFNAGVGLYGPEYSSETKYIDMELI